MWHTNTAFDTNWEKQKSCLRKTGIFFLVVVVEGCLQEVWKWRLFSFTIPGKRFDWSQFVITDVKFQKLWHQWIIKNYYIVKKKKRVLETQMSDCEYKSVKSPLSNSHISEQLWSSWNPLRWADKSTIY